MWGGIIIERKRFLILLKWGTKVRSVNLHLLQFFQWFILLQCSSQSCGSSGGQTTISEAAKQLYRQNCTSKPCSQPSVWLTSFWSFAVCKNKGGRPGTIYHRRDRGRDLQTISPFHTCSSFCAINNNFSVLQGFRTPTHRSTLHEKASNATVNDVQAFIRVFVVQCLYI